MAWEKSQRMKKSPHNKADKKESVKAAHGTTHKYTNNTDSHRLQTKEDTRIYKAIGSRQGYIGDGTPRGVYKYTR